MILIFSNKSDITTTQIIEWLHFYNKPFIRIDSDEETKIKIEFVDLNAGDIIINYNNKSINLKDVSSVWYRRGGISKKHLKIDHSKLSSSSILANLPREHLNFHQREFDVLSGLIHSLVEKNPKINSKSNASLNKLIILDKVSKYFTIPASYIVTTKAQLLDLQSKNGDLITKALAEGLYAFSDKHGYYTYTEKIMESDLVTFPDTFFPSLVQVQIKKKYELRIFFLNDICYAMAIFSQRDSQTQVDFRKYNEQIPNRNVPYKLPDGVSQKIKALMKEIDLNCGSIDMIVDEEDNYIFLEINPVGQFSMTSIPCNYYLEKKIAQTL